jgi:hypothetical protein
MVRGFFLPIYVCAILFENLAATKINQIKAVKMKCYIPIVTLTNKDFVIFVLKIYLGWQAYAIFLTHEYLEY